MTTTVQAPENRQILEEATAWFMDFRLGEVGKTSRLRFIQWLQRSPEHVRAYVEIAETYVGLPSADAVGDAEIERLIEHLRTRQRAALTDAVVTLPASTVSSVPAGARPRRIYRLAASVAGLALLAMSAWLMLNRDPVYTTGVAEQRSFTLEDGSKLELNARTRLKVHYTAHERRIDLLEGQALFHVSKDVLRPFIVRSGEAQVQAVGTQFDVHLRESGTTVTVLEGRVAIRTEQPARMLGGAPVPASNADGAAARLVLSAGEQVLIKETAVTRFQRPRIAAATAWTQGEVEFDETPLADALEDFNRHSRVRLVFDGAPPLDLRISGVYSSQDVGSFVRFLRSQPDLVVTETDTAIHIRHK